MKIFNPIYVLLFSFAFMGLYSCKSEPVKHNPDEISIRIKRDPAKLNPIVYPSSAAREIYQYILVPLADFNPKTLELEPILIKSIPNATEITEGNYKGGVSYELEFLADAKWDDGSDINGEDLAFTLKTVKSPLIEASGWRAFFDKLVDIQVDRSNPKKVKAIFSEPYMLGLEALVTANLYPKHIYDPSSATDAIGINGNPLDDAAVLDSSFVSNFNGVKHSRDVVQGAGPYKLSSWETDQYVVLEKKNDYWAVGTNNPHLQAYPEKMVFKIIPDETTALALMQDGELDVMVGVSGANFDKVKNESPDKFSYLTPQLIRFYYMALNNEDPILSDIKVRKALAYCTDVDLMIQSLENGYGKRQNSIFHATKPYSDKNLKSISLDLALAKKELQEAGWEDTDGDGVVDKILNGKKEDLVIDVLISKSPLGKKVSIIMQQEAEKVGMKINLLTKSRGEIAEAMKTGNYQASPSAITSDPNSDDPFNKWHSSGGRNYVNYSNPDFDQLVDLNRVELDPLQRAKRYKEMQSIMAEDYPIVFLYSPQERTIISKDLDAEVTPKRPGYLANTFSSRINVPSAN